MRLILIFFILISNFANSQEFQNVPVLWTGSEFTKEGEKVSTLIQFENRQNLLSGSNGFFTRIILSTTGKVRFGGGLVFSQFEGNEQIRLNQSIIFRSHRILVEEIFSRNGYEISRIRYRFLPSIRLTSKSNFLIGLEPFLDMNESGIFISQCRVHILYDLNIGQSNLIRIGFIPELVGNRINYNTSIKILFNF